MGENKAEPLAKTRTRRSNAGARMHEMMFAAETDELFAQAYGGLIKPDDDSSDDEEYVPKDLQTNEGELADEEDDDDDDEEDDDDDDESDTSDGSGVSDEENQDDNLEGASPDGAPTRVNNKDNSISTDDHQTTTTGGPASVKRLKDSVEASSQLNAQLESAIKTDHLSALRTCSVCLGDHSEDEWVIECDSCGVQVHESCYGVSNNDDEADNNDDTPSNHSHTSSKSTEPWFCEPCIRSVQNPYCELCPNRGGIFKQTDTGRWVHMVCALYTRGVTFENIENLSGVSLFELNYALFGSKTCTICEDRRLARSGICIGCDAGLCKTFFHATCAQKEGLLFESHSDEVDPYFAQCRQHADKTIIRKKKRTCTALYTRLKRLAQSPNSSSCQYKEELAKLRKEPDSSFSRWTTQNRPPIPPKASRMLMTSPSLVMKLTKKSELLGLDPTSASYTIQDEIDMARQKWHIPPSFDLEFVAYCKDRIPRMARMKKANIELASQNTTLKAQESSLREKYNSIKVVVEAARSESEILIKEARALQKLVSSSTGKQFNLPLHMEQLIARCRSAGGNNLTKTSKTKDETSSTYGCGKCGTVKDQHLLALCDTCHAYLHIYCLDPPLSRVPKKTRFGGWQCSDCSERDEEEQEETNEEQQNLAIQEVDGPRRLRERIKFPDKYSHESMLMADFWSTHKKRPKKSSKSSKRAKKIKLETQSGDS